MRTFWHEVWGSAHGPVRLLAPQTRIVTGAAMFAVCMIAPAATRVGLLVIGATTVSWLVACRPPWKTVRSCLLLGLLLLLPYLLLALLSQDHPAGASGARVHPLVVWSVFVRGMGAMLVSIATVTSLSVADLSEGLGRLPIPSMVSSILLQIVQQTAVLWYETRRVASAMAVRGASGTGRAAWRVLCSLPGVWLPRVILRAERVTAAMEVRGYAGPVFPCQASPMRAVDAIAIVLVLCVLALAVALRWWSPA